MYSLISGHRLWLGKISKTTFLTAFFFLSLIATASDPALKVVTSDNGMVTAIRTGELHCSNDIQISLLQTQELNHMGDVMMTVIAPSLSDDVGLSNILLTTIDNNSSVKYEPFNKKTRYLKQKLSEHYSEIVMTRDYVVPINTISSALQTTNIVLNITLSDQSVIKSDCRDAENSRNLSFLPIETIDLFITAINEHFS